MARYYWETTAQRNKRLGYTAWGSEKMTNPKEVTIPVRHWAEDEFFSEPDENGVSKGQIPLFMTAAHSTMSHNGADIVQIQASLGANILRVDINIEGNKHAFAIYALDFLPVMLDSIGETELANTVRDMGEKPDENSTT